ncbi:MAG: hypothetical protein KGJ80_20175, partial [Chloroflexota bacterium]|nr:hypothetical protein [Chloroflexota bacterium]
MNARRLIFVLTLVVLIALAACAPAPTPTPAPVFKVAVLLPSAANDLSFSQSMYDALVKVQNTMGKDK